MSLFGRQVYVEIGPEGGPGIRLATLRVGFRVEYKASKGPPTATIRVFNCAPSSVALMRSEKATIRLSVGYDAPRIIFQGPAVKDGIDVKVDGGDRILVVDAADGGRAYVETFLQAGLSTASTFGQVLAIVLDQTSWARGFIDPTIESVALPHGVALVGRPAEVMDRLAAAAQGSGAEWFLRDGALYVVRRGQSTPEVALELSSTRGNLIGSPNGTKKGVKVRALIDATMRPGRAFVVDAAGVSGTYVCKDVTFSGDSGWDNEFYMDITGTPRDEAA